MGTIIGRNPSVSKSQMVTCCDLSEFLELFKVYSIGSPKMMGNFPRCLELQLIMPQAQPLYLY